MRGVGENLRFGPMRLSETGRAVWRSLASVTSLMMMMMMMKDESTLAWR